MAGLCKCPPPPLMISTVQSAIPRPKQPTVPASLPILKKKGVWPSCGSILRPPPVALVIPQRRPIRPDLMKPMPQAAGCVPPLVLRWHFSLLLAHPCFVFSAVGLINLQESAPHLSFLSSLSVKQANYISVMRHSQSDTGHYIS